MRPVKEDQLRETLVGHVAKATSGWAAFVLAVVLCQARGGLPAAAEARLTPAWLNSITRALCAAARGTPFPPGCAPLHGT
jgi:hypothetical protein